MTGGAEVYQSARRVVPTNALVLTRLANVQALGYQKLLFG
jgi:hypothetical protein